MWIYLIDIWPCLSYVILNAKPALRDHYTHKPALWKAENRFQYHHEFHMETV